ncbi:hypothetical protein [Nostoc sp.]
MYKPKSDSQSNTEGWKTINWRQAEKYVFKLHTSNTIVVAMIM